MIDLATNVEKQLTETTKKFEGFSIALNESTDVTDTTAQCVVFIRGVDSNLNLMEKFLKLIPLKSTKMGHDIFQVLEKCIEKLGLSWDKLVSITNDVVTKLTDKHLQAPLRVASVNKLKPNLDDIIDEKRCQMSSQNRI
ncbi:unnamed protein product [Lepeophtheirus salmonis]|uniref:(salmon louse) hypothetical protein n=1 Tax=Lepeophtheirus salmonis TaxID=72036 RepID=A0A7R8CZM5_LEPSM|nr:unnamed protein product [Lepeophtheirus salmonis]CAF2977257.1 unnamed protein product [Lepeophtheirus salmonis]